MINFSETTLFFDIESHSVTERYDKSPREFVRLFQYAWGEGPVQLTTDLEEMRSLLRFADRVVGANIIAFDLPAVFGQDSLEPVLMARANKIFDTTWFASVANPPPFGLYTKRDGKPAPSNKPPEFRKWLGLDNQAFQLGVEGKSADLKAMAEKYSYTYEPILTKAGKPSMSKGVPRTKRIPIPDICCGFGQIPLDNSEFIEYADQDVIAVREVARALLKLHPFDDYMKSLMLKVADLARIGQTGWMVDQDASKAMAREMDETAAWVLNELKDRYNVPINRKKPLATKDGKAALTKALADVGVVESDLARTATGNPSFGGESVMVACGKVGTEEAVKLGEAVGVLAGQRSIAELLLAETWSDGRIHPDISPLQRSGRSSTTHPGITIIDSRFKHLLLPNGPDEVLVEFDLSNADARAVAAYSGDKEFAKRFLPGADGHMINAIAAWGADVVAANPAAFRQRAKAPGHGWGYKIGAKKMSETTGLPLDECRNFLKALNAKYVGVVAWQKRVSEFASKHGYVMSAWGRKMAVQPGREFTMAPALLGQNATDEIIGAGLARLPRQNLRQVVGTVHDAIVASISRETLDKDIAMFVRCFTTVFHPAGGQAIEFTLSHGNPGANWKEAAH